MAGGQGFKGNKGTGEGVYIQVVLDADDAVVKAQQLDGEVDNLTTSMKDLSGQADITATQFEELDFVFQDTTAGMKDLELQQMLVMAKFTMVVSGLNQLTGSLYKTIGGLEATNLISKETAMTWQENARSVELFTGPLELLISLEILAGAAGYPFLGLLWAKVPAFGAVGASAMTAATAIWAFLAPILLVVAAGALVVIVIGLIINNLDYLKKGVDSLINSAKSLLSIFTSIGGVVEGLTSSVSWFSDALGNNPVTKELAKAGGAGI